jgi:hypothetical protein
MRPRDILRNLDRFIFILTDGGIPENPDKIGLEATVREATNSYSYHILSGWVNKIQMLSRTYLVH